MNSLRDLLLYIRAQGAHQHPAKYFVGAMGDCRLVAPSVACERQQDCFGQPTTAALNFAFAEITSSVGSFCAARITTFRMHAWLSAAAIKEMPWAQLRPENVGAE